MGTSSTGRRRNRSWPEALKREIVAASLVPGSSVSVVARQYDVNANLVFSWRRRYSASPVSPAIATAPQVVPMMITAEPDSASAPASTVGETIEIDLVGKYRVRVGSGVDGRVLRRVLDVLERR
jgi:transposase-like protein